MELMQSTTITISDKTRKELLRVAGVLQLQRGKKVDYEDVIQYLLQKRGKDEKLLRSAVIHTGWTSEEIRDALNKGRAEDRRGEEELGRRYT
jgi:predicted CopG family antitoxin